MRTLLASALLLSALPALIQLQAGETRTITDMTGSRVEIPARPQHIASMHCVSGPGLFVLGGGDRICLMGKPTPWASRLYPEIRKAETERTGKVEQLQALKVDLVIYTTGMFKGKGAEFKAAGFKTVCAYGGKTPRDAQEYLSDFKAQMRFYGEILGPEGRARAERYCRYFDDRIGRILAITSKIRPEDRPKVYYGWKGGKAFQTLGRGSVMHWNTEIAGGQYLPQVFAETRRLQKKDFPAWDPDVLFVSGGSVAPESVKADPDWKATRAAGKGRIFPTPQGIYSWDNASGETPLLILYMAKAIHPELFKDWDMVQEMKAFYGEVYGKAITDQDAERILKCLPPL